MAGAYEAAYRQSLAQPAEFWGRAAEAVHWQRRWSRVLDDGHPPLYRWFVGGELNTCYNALDRHVAAGRGQQTALIYDSPVTQTVQHFTYAQLTEQTARFAGALVKCGVTKGDRVIIYMPMVPQAVVAMLACARIGAVHSVVFGGFAPKELATRINDARPKVIVSASCGIEGQRVIAYKPMLDEAIALATHKPQTCIILQRPQLAATLNGGEAELRGTGTNEAELSGTGGEAELRRTGRSKLCFDGRDIDWATAVEAARPAECVTVAATDPLYILYTSGTTGIPKGVVRDHGGHAVALAWTMRNIYNVQAGDVYWAASDIGWVVGHSYIVYGPLLAGCTTVLYEGKPVGTPDAGAFWRVIAQHGVKVLFTAPTAFRAIKREDPQGALLKNYDLRGFQALFLAGERCDPDTLKWAQERLGVPVIDHWWQTETGWAIAGNCLGLEALPVKPGSPTKAAPGYDVRILDEGGDPVPAGQTGNIAIKLPLPPGCLPTLWNNDQGYIDSYLSRYPGYYLTGDAGYQDADGYLYIMSRIDDIINVAGHRLSTGGMEEVLAAHRDVAECSVIGVTDALKGEVPVGLVVLKAGVTRPQAEIVKELVQMIRDKIGAVASFKQAVVVQRLPKTRSGKILRGTMKKIADGTPYKTPATIDDPAILTEVGAALQTIGLARGA